MLSESSFSDRAIVDEFYATLFNHFYEMFEPSLQVDLDMCTFGIVPSQTGVRTLFIVAANQHIAARLRNHVDTIIDRVVDLMPGVERTAICFLPPDIELDAEWDLTGNLPPSKFLMGQVFQNPQIAIEED
jgi:hypothetical protein